MRTVWITGAAGLIGSHLMRVAEMRAPGCRPIGLTRQTLDLTDPKAVTERFFKDSPDLLIHCAALSNTGECERHPKHAEKVNVELTAFLSELFKRRRMIFFSTDLVFDGERGGYVETDAPRPLGVYARTKRDAESKVLAHAHHLVIRTSINGGVSPSGQRGFNEVIENTWREGRTTRLFTDEFRCPIPAVVTARATWELAGSDAGGIVHLAGAERLSRLQIGQLLAERHPELQPRIEAVSLRQYPGPPRPADCSLHCARAQSLLSFPLPGLTQWLKAHPNEPF